DLSFQEVAEAVETERAANGKAVEAVELIARSPAVGLQAVLAYHHGPRVIVVEAVGHSAAFVVYTRSEREGAGNRHCIDSGHGRRVGTLRADVRQSDQILGRKGRDKAVEAEAEFVQLPLADLLRVRQRDEPVVLDAELRKRQLGRGAQR